MGREGPKSEKKRKRDRTAADGVEEASHHHKRSKSAPSSQPSAPPLERPHEPLERSSKHESKAKANDKKKKHRRSQPGDEAGVEDVSPAPDSKPVTVEDGEAVHNEAGGLQHKKLDKKRQKKGHVGNPPDLPSLAPEEPQSVLDSSGQRNKEESHEPSSSKHKHKHRHKDKHPHQQYHGASREASIDVPASSRAPERLSREEKKRKKKQQRHRSEEVPESPGATTGAHTVQGGRGCAIGPAAEQETDDEADPEFPFFEQSVSLYVPFYPVGFDRPISNVAIQVLDPLLNHYSPLLRGVLLGYSNLNLADRPVRASVVDQPTDETPALLRSVDEYAVGFGFLTFDANLFMPSRGSWMEGTLNLQSEGYCGFICWGKFNASVEAKRLPTGWRWIDRNALLGDEVDDWDEAIEASEADAHGNQEDTEGLRQMHTTGYWVDGKGRKVAGRPQRFRIKDFACGQAGEFGYLSIEGTFLDNEAEHTLKAKEREVERQRRAQQNPYGLLRPMTRQLPEFSMTRLRKQDPEEDSGQRTVLYKGSRPGTPDD